MKPPGYTWKQELANSLTHGLGILLSLVGVPLLCWFAIDHALSGLQWFSLAVYGFSLLMVYVNSTFYHALLNKNAKQVFKVLDHISIYFLIAGTTTFFVVRYVDSPASTYFLLAQWSLVAAGTIFKLFFTGRFKLLSTLLYIGLGLMVVFIFQSLWANMPLIVLSWIIVGGLCYVSGTVFYLWKRLYYQHAIWHLFVLGGSISHYIAFFYSIRINS